jgi:hypothetical protein
MGPEPPSFSERFTWDIDTTLTIGAGMRTAESDDDLIFLGNDPDNRSRGSTDPFYSSADDGNLNYEQFDFYSANIKAIVEVDLNYDIGNEYYKNIGAFVRIAGFFDVMGNCAHCTHRTDLSSDARHRSSVVDAGVIGAQFLFLDAYLDNRFQAIGRDFGLRFGNQVLSWGESLFFQGGINTTNSFDVAKIRVPGSELREALMPAPMVRISADIIDNLSLEAYYQFHWFRTHLDPAGSFFSTNDFLGRGADQIYGGNDKGSGCFDPNPWVGCVPFPPLDRLFDNSPSNQGQWGVALHYYLNAITTEFGAFYIRYHNKTPSSGFVAQCFSPVSCFGATFPIGYFRDYAEKIDLYGFSFATEIFSAAVSGEFSYRTNDQANIRAVAPAVAEAREAGFLGQGTARGFVREDRLQAQMSVIALWSQSTRWGVGRVIEFIGADDVSLTTEVAVTHYPDLDKQCTLSRTTDCTPYAGNGPLDARVDDIAAGFQTLLRFTYANPFGVPITLNPSISFLYDFHGSSPNAFFVENRKAVTLTLEGDYLRVWGAKVSYSNFFGAGDLNPSSDRDFLAMSLSYSF